MIKVKMAKSTLSLAWILVLFVGLQCAIRQWVYIQNITAGSSIPFPINFNDFYVSVGNDTNPEVSGSTQILSLKDGKVWGIRSNGTSSNIWGYVIAIGV